LILVEGAGAINGTGNDLDNRITGNASSNWLTGADGNDTLDGGLGADVMRGGTGNDHYVVDATWDIVAEGANEGTDTVSASIDYTLGGNSENLVLTGAAINGTGSNLKNYITGNALANGLDGRGGDDTLIGGAGNDTLTGGAGEDNFVFNAAVSGFGNVDRITDFNVADDTIHLENAIFTSLAPGALSASEFIEHFIYRGSTGELFYDSDGFASGNATKIAVLSTGLVLTGADFLVV
jgi:Ca2+-binding RTX toxin-like protein